MSTHYGAEEEKEGEQLEQERNFCGRRLTQNWRDFLLPSFFKACTTFPQAFFTTRRQPKGPKSSYWKMKKFEIFIQETNES